MKLLIISILCLVSLNCIAQQTKLDSVLVIVKMIQQAEEDIEKDIQEMVNKIKEDEKEKEKLRDVQEQYEQSKNSNPSPSDETGKSRLLGIGVLAFGLITLIGVYFTLKRKNQGFGKVTYKLIGIIVVVTFVSFLVVSGVSKEQMTVVAGLFGTIIGYLLATRDKDEDDGGG